MLSIPSAVTTAVDSGRFSIRLSVRAEMPTGPAGLWNETWDAVISGVTYKAMAGNIQIDPVTSSTDLAADKVRVILGGLDPNAAVTFSGADWHQRASVLSLVFLDDAGAILHVMPRFVGFIDSAQLIDKAGAPSTIEVGMEANNRELSRATGRTYSDADQRQVDPSDGLLRYIGVAAS